MKLLFSVDAKLKDGSPVQLVLLISRMSSPAAAVSGDCR